MPHASRLTGGIDSLGRAGLCLTLALTIGVSGPTYAITVSNAPDLTRAIQSAEPGDTISIAPGTYNVSKIKLQRDGRVDAPITLAAQEHGAVVLRTDRVEMLKLTGAHWHIRGIDFRGSAGAHHAIHLEGDADGTIIANNRFLGFHAAIKSNGDRRRSGPYPDNVRILRNVFTNPAPRQTSAPVTPIDVVGGNDWTITENLIADFAKDGGDDVSYAAFLKGGGRNGLFARNIVVCEHRHSGGKRVGLSLGGGGSLATGRKVEHTGGVLINNVILNCPDQPGIYINRGRDSRIAHNTIFNAAGIDARFRETSAVIANNFLTGAILTRDNARVTQAGNYATGTRLSYYIPAIRSSLTYRISDYHRKFPSYLDKADITWFQALIRQFADWLNGTWLGLGLAGFRDVVSVKPAAFLAPDDARELVNASSQKERTRFDFCARERLMPADIGAIEYEAGGCDVASTLRNRYGPYTPTFELGTVSN